MTTSNEEVIPISWDDWIKPADREGVMWWEDENGVNHAMVCFEIPKGPNFKPRPIIVMTQGD